MKFGHSRWLPILVLAGCRGGSNVAPPVVTAPATVEQKTSASGSNGVPAVNVLLDDPRLTSARLFEQAKEWALAARAVREARPAELRADEACAWDYLEGRLLMAAKELAEAEAAFARAGRDVCPLAGYAKLRSAQLLARSGKADDALVRAREVPADLTTLRDDVNLVVSESLAVKGDREGALPLWRTSLETSPYGSRWVDTSVRLANALLDGVAGSPELHAQEAYKVATRVVVEAPKLADASGATQARSRAISLLRRKNPTTREALSDVERARQAEAWLDANEPSKAFEVASAVFKAGKASCKVALTRANAGAKKSPRVDVWGDAVSACEKDADLVRALYSGAKARAGKDPKLAIEWFGKLEERFPDHRLADDARFRAALLIAQGTDEDREARFEHMLRSLPDVYPSGDMKTEALFRVALAKMQAGREDWEGAKVELDRIVELTPDDRHWATAGRAEYFHARAAAATGDLEGAKTRWQHIVEFHPLSYYMLLSHARLAALDSPHAKQILDGAIARDKQLPSPDAEATSKKLAILESPSFVRAVKLLEVGDVEIARREVAASGALGEKVDAEVLWAVGAVYNRAGLFELGHAFSRGRLRDHLEHYPEGPWRERWETAYPRAYEPLVVKACEKYGLPRALTWGVMREESSFMAEAKSPANAYGLMQLIIPTARGVAVGTGFGSDEAALKRPEVSIEFGTKLLTSLRGQHRHDMLALGAYNGGSGAVRRWMKNRTSDELDLFVENIPWEETRNYVKRVMSSAITYGYLYERKSFDDWLGISLRIGQ